MTNDVLEAIAKAKVEAAGVPAKHVRQAIDESLNLTDGRSGLVFKDHFQPEPRPHFAHAMQQCDHDFIFVRMAAPLTANAKRCVELCVPKRALPANAGDPNPSSRNLVAIKKTKFYGQYHKQSPKMALQNELNGLRLIREANSPCQRFFIQGVDAQPFGGPVLYHEMEYVYGPNVRQLTEYCQAQRPGQIDALPRWLWMSIYTQVNEAICWLHAPHAEGKTHSWINGHGRLLPENILLSLTEPLHYTSAAYVRGISIPTIKIISFSGGHRPHDRNEARDVTCDDLSHMQTRPAIKWMEAREGSEFGFDKMCVAAVKWDVEQLAKLWWFLATSSLPYAQVWNIQVAGHSSSTPWPANIPAAIGITRAQYDRPLRCLRFGQNPETALEEVKALLVELDYARVDARSMQVFNKLCLAAAPSIPPQEQVDLGIGQWRARKRCNKKNGETYHLPADSAPVLPFDERPTSGWRPDRW